MFSQQLSGRASSTLWAEGHEFDLILDFFSTATGTTCEKLLLTILDQRCPSLADIPGLLPYILRIYQIWSFKVI